MPAVGKVQSALRAMSIEALRRERDRLLIDLLIKPRWKNRMDRYGPIVAIGVLHMNVVLDGDMVNRLPRWGGGSGWLYPASHLLKTVLQDLFRECGLEQEAYVKLCYDVEYRTALLQSVMPEEALRFGARGKLCIVRDERLGGEHQVGGSEIVFGP